MSDNIKAWILLGQVGASSLALVYWLTPLHGTDEFVNGAIWALTKGLTPKEHPLDTSDFGRCVFLLDKVPELRADLKDMASVSPQWAAIVANWNDLEALFRSEFPTGRGPKTYKALKAVLAGVPC